MSQIFSPRAGLYIGLALLVLLAMASGGVLAWRSLAAQPHGLNEVVEQPVPFSHKHHVGDLGLDCRFCHASVETEAVAGIPPVSTCMTCHSQLFTDQKVLAPIVASWRNNVALHWQRVHQLPDFVYFDHSIHIAKGVGCTSCHGRVDRMPLMMRTQPLTMRWCLDCHRAPEMQLRPHDQVFSMDWQPSADQQAIGRQLLAHYRIDPSRLTDCSVCHR